MKIQISNHKMIDDALCIWDKIVDDVDLEVNPIHELKLRKNSLKVVYAFHLLGSISFEHIPKILKSLYSALKEDGEIYIIENDFEYINRGILGGDLSIKEFNDDYKKETFLSKDLASKYLSDAGFNKENQRYWFDVDKFETRHYEFVMSAKK